MNIPKHVAIILDGNGRWAKSKGMPRNYGHVKGAQNLEVICRDAYNMGIKYLTMNMPCTIEAAGVTKEQFEAELDEMAAAALADRCTATNPQPVTVEDIKEIYRKAFIGKLP